MAFAIKAAIVDAGVETFTFAAQKTMYGGKRIAVGDVVFLFASETQGGAGLVARGVVSFAEAVARRGDVVRQTPLASVGVRRTGLARRRLGRLELRRFVDWADGRAESELNFKLHRQATNKVVGISPGVVASLEAYF